MRPLCRHAHRPERTKDRDRPRTARIVSFIWGVADDTLRDVYVRGKYRDVILPMVVIRRLDAQLEATKSEVLKQQKALREKKLSDDQIETVLVTSKKHALPDSGQGAIRLPSASPPPRSRGPVDGV